MSEQADVVAVCGHSGMVVTTPWKVTAEAVAAAIQLAAWFDCPRVDRQDRSVAQVCTDERVTAIVVADRQPTLYHVSDPARGLYFHPSFAQQRVARVTRGEPDRLVSAAAVRPGDVIVDATLGRGTDTLVLAAAAQATGRVVGLEASWPLLRLFEHALVNGAQWYPEVMNQLRADAAGVVLWHGAHTAWLAQQGDDSVDVVYFDPIFRHAPKRRSELQEVRAFAAAAPITDAAWDEARRVARRCVVLKERPGFGQFERFELIPDRPHGRTAFGVWRKR